MILCRRAQAQRLRRCLYHEERPHLGQELELVYVNSGKTVSQVKFKQADKVCGIAKLEAAGKKLIADVNRSRKKSAETYHQALKKRFAP